MKIRPRSNCVLVKPDDPPTQTDSGLHIIEHWRAENTGVVVALGRMDRRPDVKRGDQVIFPTTAGEELRINDERLLIIPHRDICAVIEG